MTDSNVVSLKAITPPRWEGELTTGLLDMYVNGLMNTNHEVGRRLAYELLKLREEFDEYVKCTDTYLKVVGKVMASHE
jgi:hypothetical protein